MRALTPSFHECFPHIWRILSHVGLSLTLGSIRRAIAAAAKAAKESVPCYTFGGSVGRNFRYSDGSEASRNLQLSHEVIRINEQFLQELREVCAERASISLMEHTMPLARTTYILMRWRVALPQFV